MVKKSDHIRVRPHDKVTWKEYCDALGTRSPDLFSKVMKSEQLKLNQRIIVELQKKQEAIKRRLAFQNGKK